MEGDLGRQNSVNGRSTETLEDASADDVPASVMPEGYPPLAPLNALAKEYDHALLHHCTVARMRTIAKDYPNVNQRLTKPELFQALHDAMTSDQMCDVCKGDCDPMIHLFPPTREPPRGWVRGPSGLFGPPPVTSEPGPTTMSTTPATQTQPLTPGQHLATGIQPGAELSLVNSNFRRVNPATDLIRAPSNTPDIPINDTPNPLIQGVRQQPPPPPNVAELVTTGAAAAGWPQGETSSSATIYQVQDNFEKEIEALLEEEALEQRARRAEEVRQAELQLQQSQQLSTEQRKAIELRKRASFNAAMQAEERAHKLRMDQIRAQAESNTVNTHNTYSSFLTSAPPQPHPPSRPGFLTAPVAPPTHDSRPRSVSFSIGQPSPAGLAQSTQPNPTQQLLGNVTPESIEAMIDQRLRALGHGSSHISHSSNQLCADKGKHLTHTVVNSHMASRFGVFAQPVFEIPGDASEVDMSKMHKIMTSGHDKVGSGLCYRQMRWPHRLLQTNVPGFDVVEHKDLTFHQFINGCISKFLSEVPVERLDLELANKFSFLQELVNMSFYYKHADVLQTYRLCHEAWQMKEFEFSDDWQSIKQRVVNLKSHLTVSPQEHTFKQSAKPPGFQKKGDPAGKGSGSAAGSGAGAHVKGIPKSYMKKHNICIKFNEKECPEKQSHKNKYDEKVTLRHICGGCFKADNASHAHPAHGCEKGPFESLFRKW